MGGRDGAVAAMALASRGVVLFAMLAWAWLGSPYDSSATLDLPCLSRDPRSSNPPGVEDSRILRSVVWDGVYYLRIARCGYEYEQMHAFQPLLPLLMRFISNTALRGFIPLLGYVQTLVLAGYVVNLAAFVLAALCLYRLGLYALEDETMSLRSAAFFCFNPASVFYSSLYTESLFAFLSFAGMCCFVRGSRWESALLFGLSTLARSNGILHAGFFIYQCLHLLFHKYTNAPLLAAVELGIQACCVVAPFAAFQAYGYYQICFNDAGQRPWCKATIPYLYGFVQSHYWEVGFLRYFQLKQIPNFLSASPALILASVAICTYAKYQPGLFYTVGLGGPSSQKEKAALLPDLSKRKEYLFSFLSLSLQIFLNSVSKAAARKVKKASSGFSSPANLPFVLQLLFMTCVAFFIMHVQVSTRFLSSSPVIYWLSASFKRKRTVWYVFLAYTVVGTLLFANFYPFT